MSSRDNSIGEQVDRLARQTGASQTFVRRIRALFLNKGISLEEDATPYFTSLEEAFRREQGIRINAIQTRENLQRLQHQLLRFSRVFQEQLARLKDLRGSLNPTSSQTGSMGKRQYRITVLSSGRRAPSKGKGFLVPGPKEPQ